MPPTARTPRSTPDIRVRIRNAHGKYLAVRGTDLFFTEDAAAALVLGYEEDQVAEQLETLRLTQGVVLDPVPVPLEEIYETCDRCRELFVPSMTFFDGTEFVCAECRHPAPRRRARPATERPTP